MTPGASFEAGILQVALLTMYLFAFKLVFTPFLLLAATMASRRWGAALGGFLVALPLTSGPISVFLALEHGPAFAAQVTAGSLGATAAQAVFCLVYCGLATRGWPVALAGACATFSLIAGLLQWIAPPEIVLFLLAILAVTLALYLIPNRAAKTRRIASPWWDLPLRMVLIAALVICVTLIAPYVGPKASGVLASFPIMTIIFAVFVHRMIGHEAARQLLRGLLAGLPGCAAFFYVLSLTLTRWHLLAAYGSAILCALAVQGVSLYRMRPPVTVPANIRSGGAVKPEIRDRRETNVRKAVCDCPTSVDN